MNNISADATRVTAPPSLHWACDSPALPLLAVVPPSRIEPFLFSVVCIHALASVSQGLGTEYDCINGSDHVLYEAFGPYRWQQFLFFIIFLILYSNKHHHQDHGNGAVLRSSAHACLWVL